MQLILQMAKEKTVFLISHRLANVVNADQILLLQNGEIAECGTHSELMAQNGSYAQMYKSQQQLEQYGKEEQYAE